MIRPTPEIHVHLCRNIVDFRKQMRGLSVLVEEELELDVFSSHLFAFCSRKRNHVRLLYWERNGFVIWQKKFVQALTAIEQKQEAKAKRVA